MEFAGAPFTYLNTSVGTTWSITGTYLEPPTYTMIHSNNAVAQLGTSFQAKFWVAARVQTNGTVLGSFGANTITSSNISHPSTGTYTITIPSHTSGANYGIMFSSRGASPNGTPQMWRYSNPTATQFTIYTYNYSTAVLEDPVDFTFHTIP